MVKSWLFDSINTRVTDQKAVLEKIQKELEEENELVYSRSRIPNVNRLKPGHYILGTENKVRQLFHVEDGIRRSVGAFLEADQKLEDYRIAETFPKEWSNDSLFRENFPI